MVMGWSRPITIGADLLAGRRSRDDQSLYRSTLREFRLYTRDLVEQRRQSPGGDLLSRLISTEVMGDRLTDREVVTTVMGLLITGHETAVSLIGHGAIALVRHPELREQVAGDESFAELFVEELLRYDSPVQATLRVAARDLSVGGVDVRAGSAILALLGAANRDPGQFSEPDTFDVHRSNNRSHLAFGGGPHYCVGAPLGRLEARIAVAAMAARWRSPRIRSNGVQYDKSVMLRTQSHLELDVDSLVPRSPVAVRA
jgi:cytochrome P450